MSRMKHSAVGQRARRLKAADQDSAQASEAGIFGGTPDAATAEGPEEAYARAMDKSFRLLAVRARSTGELATRLRSAGFGQTTVDRAILRLGELGYLDDTAFARQWVAERGAGAKASGRVRLEYELSLKGVPRAVVQAALAEYTQADEEIAAVAVCRVLAARAGGAAVDKARRQAYQGLMRRGFDREAIMRAIAQVFGHE